MITLKLSDLLAAKPAMERLVETKFTMADDAGKKQTAQSGGALRGKTKLRLDPGLTGEPAAPDQGQTAETKEQDARRLGNGGKIISNNAGCSR